MPKKLTLNSYGCESFNQNSRYCDSCKDGSNVTLSRILIGNLNRNGYRARDDSSNFVIMP